MKLKSKPPSHKSENTYRFVTFSERLAKVNIDVIHRIDRTGSYAEEVETYFYEALLKWKDLNLSEHFKKCFQEVSSKSQSFNMLVFHQNAIVDSLKTYLSVKNNMAVQPLLDLVVQLARDLQMDFYPHFCDFFIIITSLLETQDTEVLEWAFTSLSYLYKYLWRMMVKDMDKIYSLYSKLLAHKKEHIRNFAAESFSFLMRKVSDYDALFTLMFSNLSESPQKARGAGQLIFEMCRGVCNMFHSCATKAFPVVLQKLGPAAGQDAELPWDSVKEALDHMAESSANYVDKEHLLVLWDALQVSLKEVLGKLETSNADQANEHLERILYIYHTLVEHRKGAKITKPQSVCETLLQIAQVPGLSYSCNRLLLQVVSALLMGENLSLPASSIHELLKKVFNSSMDRDLVLSFTKEMFDMKRFEQLLLPSLLQYLEQLFCMEDSVNRQLALDLLVGLILSKAPPPTDGSMAFEKYPLIFTGQTVRSTGPERDQVVSVPQQILSLIDIPDDQPISDLSHPWAALKVKRDDEHKMVKSKEVKDEEVVRVPIAFAMVQLMKSLPKEVMEANLPGIFLKVCVHLRSRFQEIRDVTRNTLVHVYQVVKNLFYVAKVIYLISPESDTVNPAEEQEGEEKETTDNMEENEREEEKKQELEEQQNENRPPSLLWVMKKLSLLAKRGSSRHTESAFEENLCF